MSEPSSLYLRVHLSPKQFEAFQKSPLVPPGSYNDWDLWLASKKMHGRIKYRESQDADFNRYARANSVGEYLANLLQDIYSLPSRSTYSEASHQWTLCVMGLSENYKDFLFELSILRAVAQYQDTDEEDFILIYPYLWETSPETQANAFVSITAGQSRLLNDIPAVLVAEANQMLQNLFAEFSSSHPAENL